MEAPPLPTIAVSSAAAAAAAATTTTADLHSDSLPPSIPKTKLRLMCSYGGHIVPRPHDKSLCYAGGETRIVAVDRSTTACTLSVLASHLSRTLYNNRPFFLKYQLPNEDLDSLISVTTDDDLHNMLEEHDRIVNSPMSSRIRLFLFPSKPESVGSVLLDPKSESWFSDALKNTSIDDRVQSADAAAGHELLGSDSIGAPDSSVEAQVESLSNSGEAKLGVEFGSVPESMVLETSSSFGSTSSSISMANLPPIGVHGEDGGLNLLDKKCKVPSSASIESDGSVGNAISYLKTGAYQETLLPLVSGVYSSTTEAGSVVSNPSVLHMPRTVYQSAQNQQQTDLQYAPTGVQYIPEYPAGPLPISSYYPMFQPQIQQQQQQHSPYPSNLPYPIYLVPVRPMQSYEVSMQGNIVNTATTASVLPSFHPHSAVVMSTVAYREVTAAPPVHESAAKVYIPAAAPLVTNPSNQNQTLFENHPEMHQSLATVQKTTLNHDNNYDDDLEYAQIYKSQPPAPAVPSQCPTMTKGAAVLLSEVAMQHQNNVKHPVPQS